MKQEKTVKAKKATKSKKELQKIIFFIKILEKISLNFKTNQLFALTIKL